METSNILLLFIGSTIAMLGIITARAVAEKRLEFIRIQTKDQNHRDELRRRHVDSLYRINKND